MKRLALAIASSVSFTTSLAAPEDFYRKHFPPSVKMGMTPGELQAARPNALKNELGRSGNGTNGRLEMVEIRRERDSPAAFGYRFREGKLVAVSTGTKTMRMPIEHTQSAVSALVEELKANFTFKGREEIVRSVGTVTTLLTAQLWEDTKGGLKLYLVATNQDMEVIVFDPNVFGKTDFFLGPEMIEKVKANNAGIARKPGGSTPPPVAVIDLLAEAKPGIVPPPRPAAPPTAATKEPPAAKAASPLPGPQIAQVPTNRVERRAPVWPWVAGGIVVLLVLARLLLKRRAE